MGRQRSARDPDAFIDGALDKGDNAKKGWRREALGMSHSEALASRPPSLAMRTNVPYEEARLVINLARDRGIGPTVLMRMLIATYAIDVEKVDPAQVPWLAAYGTINVPGSPDAWNRVFPADMDARAKRPSRRPPTRTKKRARAFDT